MAKITFKDLSLSEHKLTSRVSHLKKIYFRAMPEICVERPRLITEAYLKDGLFEKERISVLDAARAYRYVLEHRTPIVEYTKSYDREMKPFTFKDNSPFTGSTTSKFKGVPLYPEFLALQLWPELWTITKRESNPFYISDEEVKELNYEVFPHWMEHNIQELTRARFFEENLKKYGKKRWAPQMSLFEKLRFFITSKPNCISHTIPNFSKAINLGLRGVIDEARDRELSASDDEQREFYRAIREVMAGIIAYSHNLAEEAERLAKKEKDRTRRQELYNIAKMHHHIPEYPARSFYEGLATLWLCWIAVHLENANVGLSLGRLDQVLYPLYRQSIDEGSMTVGEAVELICCLWLKIGDHVPTVPAEGEKLFGGTGSNQAITIGGVDMRGNDAVNDLTYVMLGATELMMLRDPNLNARYYPGVNSKEYLKRLCDANIKTKATPAIHNDKAVIKALTVGRGVSLEYARDYAAIGCIEPGSNGRSYNSSAAILFNIISALELTLYDGRNRYTNRDTVVSIETGDPTTFKTFEEFKEAFRKQTCWLIEQATILNNAFGRVHQDFHPTPILSALFEGPMDKGKDLIFGGATINSSAATVIGMADVADSLSAIQKVVFEDRALSFKEFLKALDNNFVGNESLQKQLVNPDKTPKYGNEDPQADANVRWIAEFLDDEFGKIENYRGGKYRVGYWTMTNHAGFGRISKATPNGRKDYENFTSGITPVSGVTPYLTKALNSVASLPAKYLTSGVALNLKYTPEPKKRNKMLNNFIASVEGYFDDLGGKRDGGMEIQFNITDHDTFVDAAKHPEKYPELLVRVSGYTAYFKDLNPQMQKEIIDRTEYLLSSGKAKLYKPFPLPKEE